MESQTAPEGRIFIVIGPHCWGRAPENKLALKLAKQNYPRGYYRKEFKPTYDLVDVPLGSFVDSETGAIITKGPHDFTWKGSFTSQGKQIPDALDPYRA